MSKKGVMIITVFFLVIIAIVIRINYVEKVKLETEIGTNYQNVIEYYDSLAGSWLRAIDNNELSKDMIKDISEAINNLIGKDEILPQSARVFSFSFGSIGAEIVEKLITNKGKLDSNENKKLLKLLVENLTILHETIEATEDNCNNDALKYYKELNNRKSVASERLWKLWEDARKIREK